MFKYKPDNWTGFEFENVHGKWRVMDSSFTDMMWRCRLIEPTVEGLAMYEDDALSNWDEDLFKDLVLLSFWATQAQAHIDALEARLAAQEANHPNH